MSGHHILSTLISSEGADLDAHLAVTVEHFALDDAA
jgi:hypothetical protein